MRRSKSAGRHGEDSQERDQLAWSLKEVQHHDPTWLPWACHLELLHDHLETFLHSNAWLIVPFFTNSDSNSLIRSKTNGRGAGGPSLQQCALNGINTTLVSYLWQMKGIPNVAAIFWPLQDEDARWWSEGSTFSCGVWSDSYSAMIFLTAWSFEIWRLTRPVISPIASASRHLQRLNSS